MERIKVLHCLETIGSGGVEQTRSLLAKYLDRERFEQKIVCTQTLGVLPAEIRACGVEVVPVGLFHSPFHWKRYRQVLEVIRDYRPHIIHGAVFEGVTMAAIAGRWGRVPGIVVEETAYPMNRSVRGNLLMRGLCSLSHRVVAVSPAVGKYVEEVLKVRPPKLRVIMNGVDIPRSADQAVVNALRQRLGLRTGDFVIGSVGRLVDTYKRFSDLIRAIALLNKEGVPARLLIVGDGPDLAALQELARAEEVEDRVVFAGYQGDTAPYYGCMDAFALASAYESFGLVLVEAMFSHLPVVATRTGGIPYVVEDGVTGFVVDRFAPIQLAEGLGVLFRDRDRARRLGEAGFQKANLEFSAGVYVGNIAGLYEELYHENSEGHTRTGVRRD